MTHRGTLRISRELVDHPVFDGDTFDRRSAWLWLLSEAAWANYRKTANGIVLDLTRGELAVSERYLAQRWQWHKSKVRRFLEKLTAEEMIERRMVSGATRNSAITVIRISNFDHWQGTAGKVTDATKTPSYLLVNHPRFRKRRQDKRLAWGQASNRTTTEPPPSLKTNHQPNHPPLQETAAAQGFLWCRIARANHQPNHPKARDRTKNIIKRKKEIYCPFQILRRKRTANPRLPLQRKSGRPMPSSNGTDSTQRR